MNIGHWAMVVTILANSGPKAKRESFADQILVGPITASVDLDRMQVAVSETAWLSLTLVFPEHVEVKPLPNIEQFGSIRVVEGQFFGPDRLAGDSGRLLALRYWLKLRPTRETSEKLGSIAISYREVGKDWKTEAIPLPAIEVTAAVIRLPLATLLKGSGIGLGVAVLLSWGISSFYQLKRTKLSQELN